MAWPFKKTFGVSDDDPFAIGPVSEATSYAWFTDQMPASSNLVPENGPAPQPEGNSDGPVSDQGAGPMPSSGIADQAAITGSQGADVFTVDIATLTAAVAPAPIVLEISGYSATQGDVIDFSAILIGSYAPLAAGDVQLRVTENAGATFATLDFNVGTAEKPHWVSLAKLDGVQVGDTVNVAVDATHTVQLQSAWLA
jgi:hypothetical protein